MLEFDAIHICKTCKTNPLDIFNETIHNHICWDCLDAQWELAMDEEMDSRSNLPAPIEEIIENLSDMFEFDEICRCNTIEICQGCLDHTGFTF